ncbi:hypothetical protein VB264_21865 [Arcicella aquatica]|uniref:Uncharacterized protein n=1 Tax=Arcicella aquatica TaxID=217141 RepID=A0ABU5QUH9_9BACT|nr:hypothetical protein [Arcicella aquatica]MEA5260459.1 hypothetical protein [Arcicella aquatica]
MKTHELSFCFSDKNQMELTDFEEAIHHSMRQYSLEHLTVTEETSQEHILEAVQKSLTVCRLAGINSEQHFKKIYVYNTDISTLDIDWRMTKKGLNLMIILTSSMNEKMAHWLWELANL